MAWETKWQAPVAADWAKPQLDKITEEVKEAEEWVKKAAVKANLETSTATAYGELKARRYKTQQIKLGNKIIQVIVVGDLGLDFCEPEEKDEGWNIYHLPTLACFSSALPAYTNGWLDQELACYAYDKQPLLNWMARVQKNYPTSWQVLRLLTPDTYQDNGGTAKEIIQKWCLSVKVE